MNKRDEIFLISKVDPGESFGKVGDKIREVAAGVHLVDDAGEFRIIVQTFDLLGNPTATIKIRTV